MVCVENGRFIGTSTYSASRYDQFPDSGEVISLYFLPDSVGRGYGALLLRAVVNALKEQGYKDVFLWVLEENHRARRFYERFGFIAAGDRMTCCIGGKDLTEVRYLYRFPD